MKPVVALALLLFAPVAPAAERIREENIQIKIAPFGSAISGLRVRVISVNGGVHTGRDLLLKRDEIQVGDGDRFYWSEPWREVARIEIRRGRQALDLTLACLGIPLYAVGACVSGSGADPCILAPFLLPGIGIAAASAPVTLAIDGVELLIPAKVYEIVH